MKSKGNRNRLSTRLRRIKFWERDLKTSRSTCIKCDKQFKNNAVKNFCSLKCVKEYK